jgi:hypothetical protein
MFRLTQFTLSRYVVSPDFIEFIQIRTLHLRNGIGLHICLGIGDRPKNPDSLKSSTLTPAIFPLVRGGAGGGGGSSEKVHQRIDINLEKEEKRGHLPPFCQYLSTLKVADPPILWCGGHDP